MLCFIHPVVLQLIMAVRRQSQGFSRGSSLYRGVSAHPSSRWESRIGVPGSKHIYLGLFEVRESLVHRAFVLQVVSNHVDKPDEFPDIFECTAYNTIRTLTKLAGRVASVFANCRPPSLCVSI